MVICKQIIEAVIPDVGRREIGRIFEVEGKGTFYTSTKQITLPAGKIQAYGINHRYLLQHERG